MPSIPSTARSTPIPHPSWSRDESQVAFASDRTGVTQVYVVAV